MKFQGDLAIIPAGAGVRDFSGKPIQTSGAKPKAPEGGVHVVAHSETGHNHVLSADSTTYAVVDEMTAIAQVLEETELRHLRDHDTHAPIKLESGTVILRRQREYTPEGLRIVQD